MGLIKALYKFKVTDAGALIGTYCSSNHAIYFITNIIHVYIMCWKTINSNTQVTKRRIIF